MPEHETAVLDLLDPQGQIAGHYRLAGKNTYRIGRAEGNDIRIRESWVSRNHAMIQVETGGAHNLIDLGSANGTFVNGRRIVTPRRLQSGDRLAIGRTVFVFQQRVAIRQPETDLDSILEEETMAWVNTSRVTVLVSDIHDFTPLAGQIGDKAAGRLLQAWSSRVNRIVLAHDGMVDKFMGDGVMALWMDEQDPARPIVQALASALAIEQMTRNLRLPELPALLGTAAAINTGEAVAGNIDGSQQFTVIGDTVNVVFRLEEMTGSTGFDILLGERAALLLGAASPWFSEKEIDLKGKGETRAFGTSFRQASGFLEKRRG